LEYELVIENELLYEEVSVVMIYIAFIKDDHNTL